MKTMAIFLCLASAVLIFACATTASAQEWIQPREIYVAPDGKPDGEGTPESPLSFGAVFVDGKCIQPGTTVWISEGTYTGPFIQGENTRGTAAAPIIFRAIPGQRATIVGGLEVLRDNVWFWGLEVIGPSQYGVNIRGGGNVRVINMVIHDNGPLELPQERKPSGQGIGGWDVGNEHEYYGNLLFHNGWFTLDHGLYSQNTSRHTTKRVIDNIIFENAGFGIHIYGSAPALANYLVEGNICFATSMLPRSPRSGEVNILIGGSKPLNNIVVKDNCTWHPNANSKRGLDIGYTGSPNRNITVENNYLMCGANAMEIKGVAEATVRNNTFWAPAGMVSVSFAPADQLGEKEPKLLFENNTYIDNGNFDLERFRAHVKSGEKDTLAPGRDGRPAGLRVFKRVNHYEPNRVHLAVYNWDHLDLVRIELDDLLAEGDTYALVSVFDFYGEPIIEGTAEGAFIDVPMGERRYEPEFGAYILFIGKKEQ